MNAEDIVKKLAADLADAPRYAGQVFEVSEISGLPGEVFNLTLTLTRAGEPTIHDLLVTAEGA